MPRKICLIENLSTHVEIEDDCEEKEKEEYDEGGAGGIFIIGSHDNSEIETGNVESPILIKEYTTKRIRKDNDDDGGGGGAMDTYNRISQTKDG